MNEVQIEPKDFRGLRRSGRHSGASRAIGGGFVWARNLIARGMATAGLTPNMLTVAGFVVTCGTGLCLAIGAGDALPWASVPPGTETSYWPLWVAAGLFLSSAFDMLDGALARVGNLATKFGAVFDSFTDRGSDAALFLGCAVYYARYGNATYVALSVLALSFALSISYVKARAENVVDRCDVGYWQRGERNAALLIAACAGHLPAALWLLGTSPALTVLSRVRHTRALLTGDGAPWTPAGWLKAAMIWRHPRGSFGYDVATGLNIAFLIVGPWIWPRMYDHGYDPLGMWLARMAG